MVTPKRKMAESGLHLVSSDQCGAKTSSGRPCKRETGGSACWQHAAPEPDTPAPEQLGQYGREEWARRVEEFSGLGLLDRIDMGLLETACEMYEEARRCQEALAKHGHIVKGRTGVKKNPASSKHVAYRREYRIAIEKLLTLARKAGPADDPDGYDPIDDIGGY